MKHSMVTTSNIQKKKSENGYGRKISSEGSKADFETFELI